MRVSTGDEWPVGHRGLPEHVACRARNRSAVRRSLDTPVPLGPRKLDQSGSAGAPAAAPHDHHEREPERDREQ